MFPRLQLPWPGHDAVVVFFVLSGFVISHAVNRPSATLGTYAVHRLARIWSVSIPALLLAAIILAWRPSAHIDLIAPGSRGLLDTLVWLCGSVMPIAHVCSLEIIAPLNAPFWSLNFEMWYYAIFGVFHFMAGPPKGPSCWPYWFALPARRSCCCSHHG